MKKHILTKIETVIAMSRRTSAILSWLEPKAQASFLIKICPLSVGVIVVVIFSHFHAFQNKQPGSFKFEISRTIAIVLVFYFKNSKTN